MISNQENAEERRDAPQEMDVVTDLAVTLSIVEIGLGSVVHGFKIPFGGHVLSLNQGMFLSRAMAFALSRREGFRLANEISLIASFMKSLSPEVGS